MKGEAIAPMSTTLGWIAGAGVSWQDWQIKRAQIVDIDDDGDGQPAKLLGGEERPDLVFMLSGLFQGSQNVSLERDYLDAFWRTPPDGTHDPDDDAEKPFFLPADLGPWHLPFDRFVVGYDVLPDASAADGLDPAYTGGDGEGRDAVQLTAAYAFQREGARVHAFTVRTCNSESDDWPPIEVDYACLEAGAAIYGPEAKAAWWRLRALAWSVLDLVEHRFSAPLRVEKYSPKSKTTKYCYVNSVVKLKVPRVIAARHDGQGLSQRVLSHQFDVIGHWRRVRGLGRDAVGEQTQSGRTWVASHRKGPADAPFKRQLRRLSLDINAHADLTDPHK